MNDANKGQVLRIGKFFIVSLERKSGGTVSITVEASSEPQAVSLAMDEAFAQFPDDKLRLFLIQEAKLYTGANATAR